MARRLVGRTEAARMRALLNKQALNKAGEPLPWDSVDVNGRRKRGTNGTTSIRDVTTPETGEPYYEIDGREATLIEKAKDLTTSRLETAERTEIETLDAATEEINATPQRIDRIV